MHEAERGISNATLTRAFRSHGPHTDRHVRDHASAFASATGYELATFIKVKAGSKEAFIDVLGEVANVACQSPGCIEYLISGVQDDPAGVFVTKFWRSFEDQRGALQLPAIAALIDRCTPLIDHVDQKLLTPLD